MPTRFNSSSVKPKKRNSTSVFGISACLIPQARHREEMQLIRHGRDVDVRLRECIS